MVVAVGEVEHADAEFVPAPLEAEAELQMEMPEAVAARADLHLIAGSAVPAMVMMLLVF